MAAVVPIVIRAVGAVTPCWVGGSSKYQEQHLRSLSRRGQYLEQLRSCAEPSGVCAAENTLITSSSYRSFLFNQVFLTVQSNWFIG